MAQLIRLTKKMYFATTERPLVRVIRAAKLDLTECTIVCPSHKQLDGQRLARMATESDYVGTLKKLVVSNDEIEIKEKSIIIKGRETTIMSTEPGLVVVRNQNGFFNEILAK